MKRFFLFAVILAVTSWADAQGMLDAEQLRKLIIAEQAIKALYIDSLEDKNLVESAVKGMVQALDPHSAYTPAKDVKSFTEPLQGEFEGIGIQYNIVDDTLVVVQTVTGGPSEKVGIMAGDRIVSANDTIMAGVQMSKERSMSLLRGKRGTKVKLGVMRQGVSGINYFTVVRDKIPLYTIDAKYMISPTIGYIRIGSFGATTHKEFVEALETLRSSGMKDLIIDLEGNGGGYLSAAVDISNELLEEGDMIVYTEGRAVPRVEYHAKGNGKMRDGKIVILIDSYSASASEILSGAIQDNDRGVVIGRRSFAKGLVQRQIDLPDGAMLRITSAHYYTPSGRCIQKPYKKGERKDYDKDIESRLKSGELMHEDSIHFADSLKYTTLKQHRTVYGGGGIMPDVYVPLDTSRVTRVYRELIAKSCVINTAIRYVDKYRKQLQKQYPDFATYETDFNVPQKMDDMLREAADKSNVKYTEDQFHECLPLIHSHFKAIIARDLWTISEYYKIINEENDIYKKGCDYLEDPNMKTE